MNHRDAWDLIPWFVNGRAAAAQRARLQQHLEQCPECRAEVSAQRDLLLAMQAPPTVEAMPHASLQKLWSRIDEQPAEAAPQAPPRRRVGVAGWLAAAIAAQALLLGVLTVALVNARNAGTDDGADFRTVSSPAATPGAPAVRAVFAPEMRLGQLQVLLERAHLRIAGGPTPEGVLTLALEAPSDDAARALAVLRADPAARFAEPIGH
jgi:hypothetical protein